MTDSSTDFLSPAVYELRNVTKTYALGGNHVHAVRDVELTVAAGETAAVVGPSGSGKTTLLQLLGALDRPSGGEVLFEGRDIARLGDGELGKLRLRTFGFRFPTVQPHTDADGGAERGDRARAERAHGRGAPRARAPAPRLSRSLRPRESRSGQASGGERQRVAIGRALANESHVLLADEPTGNLDSTTGAEIIELLLSLSAAGRRTVIVLTHDHDFARRAGRIVRMQDGRLLPAE